jgi:D-amino-acid oxidase
VKQGIRPVRPSVRLELTSFAGRPLVHNYGHGGAGFTVSWGCAGEVAKLLGC